MILTTDMILKLIGAVIIGVFLLGIRIIRPVEEGVVETLGKFSKIAESGFNWVFPIIQQMRKVNITEQMVDVDEQTVQTKDKLNTIVDAVVYYQVLDTKKSLYNVNNHERQLTSLARTTLRAVMGKLSLTECIQDRSKINDAVEGVLTTETKSYGVSVLRVEVQRIEPPEDVQRSMNEVVKAEQSKIASKDTALAKEIEADGFKKAEIKKAEGIKEAKVLASQGEATYIENIAKAEASQIKLVNDALVKHLKGPAMESKKLDVAKIALKNGTKYVLDTKKDISLVVSELAGVTPIKKK